MKHLVMRIFDEFKPLITKVVQPGKKELEYYPSVKNLFAAHGWAAIRMESKLQMGLPDFLCVRFGEVLFAEVKVFRVTRKQTQFNFEDLTWQPGQIRFLTLMSTNDIPYVLVVIAGKELTIYGNNTAKRSLCKR